MKNYIRCGWVATALLMGALAGCKGAQHHEESEPAASCGCAATAAAPVSLTPSAAPTPHGDH
jgi:hypothetical protein